KEVQNAPPIRCFLGRISADGGRSGLRTTRRSSSAATADALVISGHPPRGEQGARRVVQPPRQSSGLGEKAPAQGTGRSSQPGIRRAGDPQGGGSEDGRGPEAAEDQGD